uniref:Uncharacterized protein n=1 Tax=Populus trichocarpa TaxID=3694 RepID=A0A2K2ASY0_POPTR
MLIFTHYMHCKCRNYSTIKVHVSCKSAYVVDLCHCVSTFHLILHCEIHPNVSSRLRKVPEHQVKISNRNIC